MIGNIFLTLALIAALFSFLMYYLSLKGYTNTLQYARYAFHASAISVIIASALLIQAILTHQYQYGYVYSYSSKELPLGLLLSTFYAGQEGSFLLWAFFTVIIGLILLEYSAKRDNLEARIMVSFTLALGFLLVLINPLLKSPFNSIWSQGALIEIKNINPKFLSLPFLQNFITGGGGGTQHFINMNNDLYAALTSNGVSVSNFLINGRGLNPLLQNFWMQIHPPMLFIGFASALVPFSFAIAAMIKNEYKEWVKQSLPWLLTSSMVLGLAIMLGGYWAYGVLGWGGYWGWDPVENSSLVPWIVSVAAIHTMLVQKKSEEKNGQSRFVKTNLILSILTYVLVLYSTFLTRSGVLGDASVHSFVDPGMTVYLFLILFLAVFVIMGVGGVIYRWKYLTKNFDFNHNLLSREMVLFVGAIALIVSAFITIMGTSAPLIGTTVTPDFYNVSQLPIVIIFCLLNGLSFLAKWKLTDRGVFFKELKYMIGISLIFTVITIVLGGAVNLFKYIKLFQDIDQPFLKVLIASTGTILHILVLFAVYFSLVVNVSIAYSIVKGRKLFLGAYISHAGLSLFLLGVIATSGFSKSMQVELVKNKPVSVLGYTMKYTGYAPIDAGKKFAFRIELDNGKSKKIISPVMYNADMNGSLMREPDILTGLAKDFYVAPLGFSEGSDNGETAGNKITIEKGKSYEISGAVITFTSFDIGSDAMAAMQNGTDFQIGAKLKIKFKGVEKDYEAVMKSSGGNKVFIPIDLPDSGLRITLDSMNAEKGAVVLNIATGDQLQDSKKAEPQEVLSIEASIKPFISLVWIGVIVMVAGFVVSVVRRAKEINS